MSVSWSKATEAHASADTSTGFTTEPEHQRSRGVEVAKRPRSALKTVRERRPAKPPQKSESQESTGSYDSFNRVVLRHMMSMSDSKIAKLPNSLIEMCVVVGMDDDTGLKYSRRSQAQLNTGNGLGDVFGQPMEPSVLAVISSQLAYFPQSKVQMDPFYPPIAAVTTPMSPVSPQGFAPHAMRTLPPRRSISMSRRLSIKPRALPFPHNQEMISSLPPLCFPGDAYVQDTRPEEHFHSVVLTSISGRRSYAVCLVTHRQYSVKQMPGGGGICLMECQSSSAFHSSSEESLEDKLVCWVPTCIVLISHQPYFTLLKECLSTLIPQLKDRPYTLSHVLKEFTLQLTMVPIPPAGPVSINFLLGEVLTVQPPDHPDKPVVDIPLHLPFLLFSVDQILQIVACILTQQRIVFLSNDFAVVTPIIECFMLYILPFKWPFVYVPVVWSAMLDLLEAPGCYIMGCSSEHRQRIAQIEGLVMVDLDRGQVQVCDTVKTVPSIPRRAAEDFKEKFQQIRPGFFDIAMLSRSVPTSFEAEKTRREQLQRAFHREIQDCFLELLVLIFRDTSECINTDLRVFKKEDFLASRPNDQKEFYKQVLSTELFKQFKEDRLDQKKDYYTQVEKRTHRLSVIGGGSSGELTRMRKTSSHVQNSPGEIRMLARKSSLNDFSNRSLLDSHKNANFMMPPFRLPLSTPQIYYEECVDQLGYSIQSVKSHGVKASYLFLRGMFKIGCARPLDGLDDFHNLHSTDLSIFPFRAVEQVIDGLSQQDKEHLHKQDFYKKAEILRKISKRKKRPQLPQTPLLNLEELPQEGLIEQSEFIKHMQYTEIAIDLDVIERVFNALTASQGYLDTETLIYFHDAWKESEEEAKEMPSEVFDNLMEFSESVLKLSSLIRSDYGGGRLVLTDKRLIFLIEGSNEHREVIRLRDIERLEKFDSIYLVLQSAPALRIISKKDSHPPFVANLKAERNCWFTLITEMWAGRNIADAQKDPQVVQQAARNVLLLDAIIRSAENPGATHAKHLDAAAWQLCHFTRLKSEGMANITPETSSVLVHKFNPSTNEAQRTTVEAMIYTPGKIGDDDDNHPRLWCAMGSGKIKVFNGGNFVLEAEIDEAKDRVCCLQLVRNDQVWAGSFDTTIYIIDIVSYTANKQLVEHDDIVSDITTDEESSMAYTASLNGQVIAWDTQSLVQKNTISIANTDKLVSIKYYKGNIWCCTKDDIRVVNLEGEELRKLEHTDSHGVLQLIEAFIIAKDMVWTGCGRQGVVACWDTVTFSQKKEMKVNCRGISRLVEVNGKVWAGSKQGKIHLFDCKSAKYEKELSAHDDAVRALCKAEDRYVITGAGSRDGKVAVWRAGRPIKSKSSPFSN